MESKRNNKKINLDFEKNKIKLEKFYEEYKNKILYSEQENQLKFFKERITKLNLLEIKIARLEKFDKKSTEVLQDYKNFVSIAKEVY